MEVWFETLDDGVVLPQWRTARTAMSWDFETEPEFQKELDWVESFVREEVEPRRLRHQARVGHG